MNRTEMDELIQIAAQEFNRRLSQENGPPPRIQHEGYHTLTCDKRFENGQLIRISLHGFSFRFLTEENQKKLHFHKKENQRVGLHNHEFFEFIYVCRGTVTQHTPGGSFSLGSSHLLLMNSYVIHAPVPDNDDTIMFNFLIQKQVIENIFASLSPFDHTFSYFFLESLYGPIRDQNYLDFLLTPETEETVHSILKEYYAQAPCTQQVVYALLVYLFSQIAEHRAALFSAQKKPLPRQEETDFVPALLQYLQEHYLSVTLEELSETLGYSKYHLSRLIRKKTGKSFKELITQYKMIHAANYLEHSDFSLSKICELVGCYDKSHFTKAFKSVFSLSPRRYRQKKRTMRET